MQDALPISLLDLYDPEDPWTQDYEAGIAIAQDSQFDNLPKRGRFLVRQQLASYALKRFPDLDVAECGCWRGHSTVMTALLMQRLNVTGRFSVFDSFEGLSDYTDADRTGPADAAYEDGRKAHFRSDLAAFLQMIAKFDFIDTYPGWIPERFSSVSERQFSLVHIDVDLYTPTLDSIEFFFPRMPSGAAMFLDDFGYKDFPGARRAAEEYFARHPPTLLLRMPTGSAVVVK